MNAKTYIATFDALDPEFDPLALKTFIREGSAFEHWWNHLPYVYLFTTTMNAEDISETLRSHTKDVSFLVMEVDPGNSEGRLPEQSWKWIQSRERELARAERA